jgi:two-component system KDP operon response regulator KdpE
MPARPLKILLIEDDREIARGLKLRLDAAGHDALIRHDGGSGLAAAAAVLPDAVLLDLRLPDTDGFDVLRRMQQQDLTKMIPVLVLSANTAERAKREALLLGAHGFIEKPYDFRKLVAAVDRACRSGGRPPDDAAPAPTAAPSSAKSPAPLR